MASLCCTMYVMRPLSPLEQNSSGSGMSVSRVCVCVCVCVCVTESICTLCLCCYTLYVALSMFVRAWTSFNLLRMVYVLLFCTGLKDVMRERERKREAIPTASRRYH